MPNGSGAPSSDQQLAAQAALVARVPGLMGHAQADTAHKRVQRNGEAGPFPDGLGSDAATGSRDTSGAPLAVVPLGGEMWWRRLGPGPLGWPAAPPAPTGPHRPRLRRRALPSAPAAWPAPAPGLEALLWVPAARAPPCALPRPPCR
jgi:hypothetical protein